MIAGRLALSASERVRFPLRLVRFSLSVAAPGVPLWALYAIAWLPAATRASAGAAYTLVSALLLAVCGLALTPVAALGIRYFHYRPRLAASKYALAAGWALGLAAIWWYGVHWILSLAGVPAAWGMGAVPSRAWVSIPLATIIFYVAYAIRGLLSPRLRLSQLSRGGSVAFRAYPKALSMLDPYDVLQLLASRDGPQEGRADSSALSLLEQHLLLSSDPRFYLPMPLPIAVGFLERELETRQESGLWSGTVQIPKLDSFPAQMVVEPAVLHAAGVFAAEYVQYHSPEDVALALRYREAPKPCLEIATNSAGGDLWFVVAETSAAQRAKDHLIDTLHRFTSRGIQFDSGQDAEGNLVFRVYVRPEDTTAADWGELERCLGPETKLLSTCALSEGSNRVYASEERILKVQLIDRVSPKPLTLSEEGNILKRLEGVRGVPQVVRYTEYANFAVLSYDKIEDEPIAEYLAKYKFERRAWFRCLADLSSLLSRIHQRGVIHRDLRPDNVLVGADGSVSLIDFDQAVAGDYDTQQVDIRGAKRGIVPPCISLPELIDTLGLSLEYDEVMEQLQRAWRIAGRSDASSPGRDLAYYRWLFGHTELPGERDWFSRWDLMHRALRDLLPGARVLDLGCNLGLVATHCLLYGAQHVTGVDVYDDILEAARLVADAAGVEVTLVKGDLNSPDFVDLLLAQQYDLVLALSVAHWIEDQHQAARILSAAPTLLFEGHGPAAEEADYLRGLGFQTVELVGYSERLRALYRASRSAR